MTLRLYDGMINLPATTGKGKKKMRLNGDRYINGRLIDGFDYKRQAWAKDGRYVRCGHPDSMDCGCYGRTHEGQDTPSLNAGARKVEVK